MKWLELGIRAPAEYVEPLVEVFRRHGHGAVVTRVPEGQGPGSDVDLSAVSCAVVTTYLPMDATLQSRREAIDVAVRLISLLQPLQPLPERVVEEGEWEAALKSHFPLMRVGSRLVLRPSWLTYQPARGEVVITLDPGMAFGTGHHPTTRMCLEEVERRVAPGMRVLDLGTGSGILAIAAAKLRAAHVVALDIDPVAVQAARANLDANHAGRRVRVLVGSLPHPEVPPCSVDLVVANLTARLLEEKATALSHVVRASGLVVASGILREAQKEVEETFSSAGLLVEDRRQEGDWVALVARRQG